MKKTFTKGERLCSKRKIDSLFHSGSSFIIYPFRVVLLFYPLTPEDINPAQVIISVSKKRFKRANQRNRLKRLMREVFRLQKGEFLYPALTKASVGLNFAIQYVGKEELPYEVLYTKMNKVLTQIANEVNT